MSHTHHPQRALPGIQTVGTLKACKTPQRLADAPFGVFPSQRSSIAAQATFRDGLRSAPCHNRKPHRSSLKCYTQGMRKDRTQRWRASRYDWGGSVTGVRGRHAIDAKSCRAGAVFDAEVARSSSTKKKAPVLGGGEETYHNFVMSISQLHLIKTRLFQDAGVFGALSTAFVVGLVASSEREGVIWKKSEKQETGHELLEDAMKDSSRAKISATFRGLRSHSASPTPWIKGAGLVANFPLCQFERWALRDDHGSH
ncbi:hypothetical protein K458DRAFT_59575 [Lentithecium fluviatile CBS 122367]|uniref:Uncharacterized protein n=1 Tax=Lentithecium fluviatile CBS 122367 TaxID=1168545 RepID=A0A6G1IW49_9PLEO|nr:hypothetical protein K458DRAFT_59575 [Lentithecium fluviatile CBS 122367]